MRTAWPVAAALGIALLAGCMAGAPPDQSADGGTGPDGTGTATGGPTATGTPSGRPEPTPSATSAPGPGQPPVVDPDAPEAQQAVPQWGPEDAPLRPGAQARAGDSLCTFDFLFFDPSNATYFVGLAAHCTDDEGQVVELVDGGRIGTVAFDSDLSRHAEQGVDVEGLDFSLVLLDPQVNLQAHPRMIGHDGPTGFVERGEAALGATTALYGHGLVLGSTEATRAREGVLMFHDDHWGSDMPTVFGDSGGPVLHVGSGKALGIVSGLRCCTDMPPSTSYGPSVVWILEQLDRAGWPDVELALMDGSSVGLQDPPAAS